MVPSDEVLVSSAGTWKPWGRTAGRKMGPVLDPCCARMAATTSSGSNPSSGQSKSPRPPLGMAVVVVLVVGVRTGCD